MLPPAASSCACAALMTPWLSTPVLPAAAEGRLALMMNNGASGCGEVDLEPAARPTDPLLAEISPVFFTVWATSTTLPSCAVILPRFTMPDSLSPLKVSALFQEVGIRNVQRGSEERGRIDHRSLADDDALRIDEKQPAIRLQPSQQLGRIARHVTRASMAASGLFWRMRTSSFGAMLNCCQFTIAVFESWSSRICVPSTVTVTLPRHDLCAGAGSA